VLPQTLESMARAKPPAGGWKLVVVDNASTDASAEILLVFQSRLPLTALSEPLPGKNRALNRALPLAEGDLLVFCDDDVVVAEDWLERWRMTADSREGFDLFVGLTQPLWPGPTPQLPLTAEQVSIIFGVNEHMREGPCKALCLLGTNMAVRAALFQEGLRFNEAIGPDSSGNYAMGSETELGRRLEAAGVRCWFSEGPKVGHIVRPRQMQPLAMALRGYRWGRGQAAMRITHHYGPRRLWRKNRLRWGLYPWLMPWFSPAEAWARQWEWSADQGYEDGWRERRSLKPVWARRGKTPRVAARFKALDAA
jgi:glycosyltransferase involved in cell wall biosynthesis